MRSFAFFAVGVLAAAVGLWFLFPERVHFVVQVADDQAVREPPRQLEDDQLAVKLAALDRSLGALQESIAQLPSRANVDHALADAETRRAKEAREARERASALEQQIAELRQEVAALATRETQAPVPVSVSPPAIAQAPKAPEPAPEPALPAAAEVVVVPVQEPEPAPPPPAPAPPPRALYKLIADGSKVGFDGTSNLHDFTGATTAVTGEIEFRLDQQADAPRAVVEIDARTLDTGNKSRDKEMHGDYLESAKWTTMNFKIESLFDFKAESETRFQARARGTLLCHGKEKKVEAAFRAVRVGATGLRVEGEMPIKMTDFGITPPTSLGGLIRTHDDVRVWFVLQGRSEP
jgi:polyisoprenoid-binding protein YceI